MTLHHEAEHVHYPASDVIQELPSRPGDFHPEPLTDPDLILSHHPARATARRLPPSVEQRTLPAEPVGPNQCFRGVSQELNLRRSDADAHRCTSCSVCISRWSCPAVLGSVRRVYGLGSC